MTNESREAVSLLVVDDDRQLCQLLATLLQLEGYRVRQAYDGRAALAAVAEEPPHLILLDLMMPGLNGHEVLRRLRPDYQGPVLMLTARGDPIDKVQGLDAGADDYLAKPFDEAELLARLRALLRRQQSSLPQLQQYGDLRLDDGALEAWLGEQLLALTAAEYKLLAVLASQPGVVISRERLCQQALGRRLSPFDRSLDVHVSHLRQKLPPRSDGRERIKTVRGQGYLWVVA
jgi:two-component system, OmpR family, response regulator CpxR